MRPIRLSCLPFLCLVVGVWACSTGLCGPEAHAQARTDAQVAAPAFAPAAPSVQDSLLQRLVLRSERLDLLADTTRHVPPSEGAAAAPPLHLQGLLVDQTITRFGQDFLDAFRPLFDRLDVPALYSVTVRETLTPSRSTRIEVLVRQEVVFQSLLAPQPDARTHAGRQAARHLHRYLRAEASSS